MKPCLSQATTMGATFAEDILAYAEAGFTAIDVWLTKLEQHLEIASVEQTRGLLAEHGITPVSASYQGGLLLAQGEERKVHFELFQRRLGLCQQLGIELLLVVPDFADRLERQDMQRARISLSQAGQLADSYGVRLAIEFRSSTRWCACLETARMLVESCGADNLGVALDAFHYYTGPSKLEDLQRLQPQSLFIVHVCDLAGVPRELATDGDRILPGDGDFELRSLLGVLHTIGYTGPLSVELFNPDIWRMKPGRVAEAAYGALQRSCLHRSEAIPGMEIGVIGADAAGLKLARAGLATRPGFHLAAYAGPDSGFNQLCEWGLPCPRLRDLEEFLALGSLEAVLVADDVETRAQTLRRAVQSDKHVLCVHPPDLLPDITYEVAMTQQETRKLLLPLLPQALSPSVLAAREGLASREFGALQLVQWERSFPTSTSMTSSAAWEHHPLTSLWGVLRAIGDEIKDVSAVGAAEELLPDEPLTVTGSFVSGGVFRVLLTPTAGAPTERIVVQTERGQAEIVDGSLRTCIGGADEVRDWPNDDEHTLLATEFASQLAGGPPRLHWLDATRCLELFEAARSSGKRRRVIALNYEEFTEASSFKGTMTALGCGVLVALVLVMVGLLVFRVPLRPAFLYVLLPLLGLFLGLQILRWILPDERKPSDSV